MLDNEYLTINETLDFLNKNTQSQINFEYLSNLVLRKKLAPLIEVDNLFTLDNKPTKRQSKYRIIAYCSFDGRFIRNVNISAVGSYIKSKPNFTLADIPKEFIIYEFFSCDSDIELSKGSKIYTPFPIHIKTGQPHVTGNIVKNYAITKDKVRFHIDELKKLIGMIEQSSNPQAELEQLQSENEQLKAELEQVKEQLAKQSTNPQSLPANDEVTNTILNYDEIKAVKDVYSEFWINYIINDNEPRPKQEFITRWITEKYPITNSMAKFLDKIIRQKYPRK